MKTNKVIASAIAASAIAAAAVIGIGAASATAHRGSELETNKLIGVPAGLTMPGGQPDRRVRELAGGGLPWVIGSSKVEVSGSGKVEVAFRGLQFAPGTPAQGSNPVASMKVVVSCLSESGAVVNTSTPTFPVTTGVGGGDGSIEAHVDLPSPCLAPLVFVTNPAGVWFAVNGL